MASTFAKPLRAELDESDEVKLLLSAGLLVLIEGEERTALQIGHRSVYPEGYEFIGDTVLRYIGQSLSERGHRRLGIVSAQLHQIYADPDT